MRYPPSPRLRLVVEAAAVLLFLCTLWGQYRLIPGSGWFRGPAQTALVPELTPLLDVVSVVATVAVFAILSLRLFAWLRWWSAPFVLAAACATVFLLVLPVDGLILRTHDSSGQGPLYTSSFLCTTHVDHELPHGQDRIYVLAEHCLLDQPKSTAYRRRGGSPLMSRIATGIP